MPVTKTHAQLRAGHSDWPTRDIDIGGERDKRENLAGSGTINRRRPCGSEWIGRVLSDSIKIRRQWLVPLPASSVTTSGQVHMAAGATATVAVSGGFSWNPAPSCRQERLPCDCVPGLSTYICTRIHPSITRGTEPLTPSWQQGLTRFGRLTPTRGAQQ